MQKIHVPFWGKMPYSITRSCMQEDVYPKIVTIFCQIVYILCRNIDIIRNKRVVHIKEWFGCWHFVCTPLDGCRGTLILVLTSPKKCRQLFPNRIRTNFLTYGQSRQWSSHLSIKTMVITLVHQDNGHHDTNPSRQWSSHLSIKTWSSHLSIKTMVITTPVHQDNGHHASPSRLVISLVHQDTGHHASPSRQWLSR